MKFKYILLLLISSCFFSSPIDELPTSSLKINGVTFDGPAYAPITSDMFLSLEGTGTSWIGASPEAMTYRNTLGVQSFYKEGQWYGETLHGSITIIEIAKSKGYKVMMKPHIDFSYDVSDWNGPEKVDLVEKDKVIRDIVKNSKELSTEKDARKFQEKLRNHKDIKRHYEEIEKHYNAQKEYIATLERLTLGRWRGDFEVKDTSNWKIWEDGYEQYILDCARIADSTNVDLFCIGTELSSAAVKRADFWRELIKKVKQVYSGPLTFGANWDNFQNIEFWDDLEYIGISAYFPLSNKKSPSVRDALKGWKKHARLIEEISERYARPVLFTEYGYKSIEYAGKEPWSDNNKNSIDEGVQQTLYKSLYETFWDKNWFAGGFAWKWFYSGNGGEKSFSPQGKMAEQIMTERYLSNR